MLSKKLLFLFLLIFPCFLFCQTTKVSIKNGGTSADNAAGAWNNIFSGAGISTNCAVLSTGSGGALTCSPISYLPLSGGTLTGPLNGTSASFSGTVAAGTVSPANASYYPNALPASSYSLAIFGDSLTCGGQGNSYGQSPQSSVPYLLSASLKLPVANQGVGGNTSRQIAVRANAGGSNQTVTLSGPIPTSGSVQVSFPLGWEPVTSAGGDNGAGCYLGPAAAGTNGNVLGVAGTFTYSGSLYYFTPTVYPGSPVGSAGTYSYTVSTPYSGDFLIAAAGTNDVAAGISDAETVANVRAIVATTSSSRYLVFSVSGSMTSIQFPTPNADFLARQSKNAALVAAFPGSYVDVWTPLFSGCSPIGPSVAALDTILAAAGVVNASCNEYNSGQPTAAITSTSQSSVCLGGPGPSAGFYGYLSNNSVTPTGSVEIIQFTSVGSIGTGGCTGAWPAVIVRGVAGTTPTTYTTSSYWGYWDPTHHNAAGYAKQAAVAASWYTNSAADLIIGNMEFSTLFNSAITSLASFSVPALAGTVSTTTPIIYGGGTTGSSLTLQPTTVAPLSFGNLNIVNPFDKPLFVNLISGLTGDQSEALCFGSYLGVCSFEIVRGSSGVFSIKDVVNGIGNFVSTPAGSLSLSSDAFGVYINNAVGSGTSGMSVYSGGATPALYGQWNSNGLSTSSALYFEGVFGAANYYRFSGTPSGQINLTPPSASGTLAALNAAQTWTAVQTFSVAPVFSAGWSGTTGTFTASAPTVSAGQIGFGGTTAATANCGSLSGASACIVVNVAGTPHYVPFY